MPLDRPIPAFYCCYLLRSTVRHSSLYVGSTPNPVRRLRQHNGAAKGGAVRTSRDVLRPWEMAMIVTGFPSHIAALQFEWAWQNPHLTLHIPPSLRLTFPTEKKASGRPKRPRNTLTSLLSNLQLLLRVPSFSRWPLELRFFVPDVHKSWSRIVSPPLGGHSDSLSVVLDFPAEHSRPINDDLESLSSTSEQSSNPKSKKKEVTAGHGIAALPLTYAPHKQHAEKSKAIIDFEREGTCSICSQDLINNRGIYAICSHAGCQSISHLTCLSRSFLEAEPGHNSSSVLSNTHQDPALVPVAGKCTSCGGTVKWVDIVKEVTLRMRGTEEVERLLKKPREKALKKQASRRQKHKGANASAITLSDTDEMLDDDDNDAAKELSDSEDDDLHDDERDNFDVTKDHAPLSMREGSGDEWLIIDDSDDDDLSLVTNTPYTSPNRVGQARRAIVDPLVVERLG